MQELMIEITAFCAVTGLACMFILLVRLDGAIQSITDNLQDVGGIMQDIRNDTRNTRLIVESVESHTLALQNIAGQISNMTATELNKQHRIFLTQRNILKSVKKLNEV